MFLVAATGRQVRHENGRTLYESGRRATDLEFLLDGTVRATSGSDSQDITAPAAIGFDEVFEGAPQQATTRASGIAICLSIGLEPFLGLLSESTEPVQGIFRQLVDTERRDWKRVVKDVVRPPSAARLRDGLQPIEKVLVLEEMPVFSRASSDQLAALASISREMKMTPGEYLFRESDSPAMHIILEGALALEPMAEGAPLQAAAGDAVGVYEMLGGLEHAGWRGRVSAEGVALRVDREALFELLSDQIDLVQGLFSALRAALSPVDA